MNMFDLLDEKFNIITACRNLFNQINTSRLYHGETFLSIFENNMRFWKYNYGFYCVEDYFKALEIPLGEYFINMKMVKLPNLNDENSCLIFLQFLDNALLFMYLQFKSFPQYKEEFNIIKTSLNKILDKIGYESKIIDDDKILLVEKNNTIRAIAEAQTNTDVAFKLYEYKAFEYKNDIKKKKEILVSLSHETEKITSKWKEKGDFYNLYDKLDRLLNNFNLRHNNVDINKRYDLSKISHEELLKIYDITYDLIVAVLSLEIGLKRYPEISELKKYLNPQTTQNN